MGATRSSAQFAHCRICLHFGVPSILGKWGHTFVSPDLARVRTSGCPVKVIRGRISLRQHETLRPQDFFIAKDESGERLGLRATPPRTSISEPSSPQIHMTLLQWARIQLVRLICPDNVAPQRDLHSQQRPRRRPSGRGYYFARSLLWHSSQILNVFYVDVDGRVFDSPSQARSQFSGRVGRRASFGPKHTAQTEHPVRLDSPFRPSPPPSEAIKPRANRLYFAIPCTSLPFPLTFIPPPIRSFTRRHTSSMYIAHIAHSSW